MLHSKASKFAILVAVCLLGIGGMRSAHAQAYILTHLGPLSGMTQSNAFGINNLGQVVGMSYSQCCTAATATQWNGGISTELTSNGYSVAYAINNSGEVAGVNAGAATVWNGGIPTALAGGGGPYGSVAYAINDAGQVAGRSSNSQTADVATLWSGSSTTYLAPASGMTASFGYGINNSGEVVGWSGDSIGSCCADNLQATLWSNGTVTDLGPGVAQAINNSGTVVGITDSGATEWEGSSVIDLEPLIPGSNQSNGAFAINDEGQVVGQSNSEDQYGSHATIWNDGVITDLNTVLSSSGRGWLLQYATGINDIGQIVGVGTVAGGPIYGSAFLLTPCPTCQVVDTLPSSVQEPSTWAMMLLGLAGLGYAGYRRASAA